MKASSAPARGNRVFRRFFRDPARGLRQVICTDIAKDGMLSGPSVDLYRKLLERFPRIELTASGGISSWDDIEELDRAGVPCVVVGKAIYEGRIGFDRLETHYGAAER